MSTKQSICKVQKQMASLFKACAVSQTIYLDLHRPYPHFSNIQARFALLLTIPFINERVTLYAL